MGLVNKQGLPPPSLIPLILGVMAALLLLIFGFGAIFTLLSNAPIGGNTLADIDWDRILYSLRITVIQAGLSTLASILIAIPASITTSRRRYWPGMQFFITSIALVMVIPTTVAAMGLLATWGRNGIFNDMGILGNFNIYGLHGVILAHMMLNVPLIMRVMIPLLNAVPDAKWRMAGLLGFNTWQRFRYIEYPAIKGSLTGGAGLVFLLCFSSFSLVLLLGGGPKVTTLEVEIYSAIRFEFDRAAAAVLSFIQFGITALLVAMLAWFGTLSVVGFAVKSAPPILPRRDLSRFDTGIDILIITIIKILVVLPVVMVAWRGSNSDIFTLFTREQFYDALQASLSVAGLSALATTIIAFALARAKADLIIPHRYAHLRLSRFLLVLFESGITLYLVIPAIVLGSAAFIILGGRGDVFGYAFVTVMLANILLALPFGFRIIERRLSSILAAHDKMAAHLGITGLKRLTTLTLPSLRHDLGLVAGLTAALSMGDLGVIALFSSADFKTLPWLLYQLAGRYALDEALALALVLIVLTVIIFIGTRLLVNRILGIICWN